MSRSLQTVADNLLSRLNATASYNPSSVSAFGDPSLEAGDIITIRNQGADHTLPIFSADMNWNGTAMTTMSASGNENRAIQNKQEKEDYDFEVDLYDTIRSSNASLSSSIGSLSTDVNNLKNLDYGAKISEEVNKYMTKEDGLKYTVTEAVKMAIDDKDTGVKATVGTEVQKELSYYVKTATLESKLNKYATIEYADGKYISGTTSYVTADTYSGLVEQVTSLSNGLNGRIKNIISATTITDTTSGTEKTLAQIVADQTNINSILSVSNHSLFVKDGSIYIGSSGNSEETHKLISYGGATLFNGLNLKSGDLKITIGGTDRKVVYDTIPVVTSFEQALGQTAEPTDKTFLELSKTGSMNPSVALGNTFVF